MAECTGSVESTVTEKKNTMKGISTISDRYPDITGVAVPVTITAGFSNIPTTKTMTTSTSKGGAPRATQHAAFVRAVMAAIGGVAML